MKIGEKSTNDCSDFGPLVFRRGPNSFLAFYAQPVWDLDEFYAVCPEPVNKAVVFTPEGKKPDPESTVYRDDMAEFYAKRWGFTILRTLVNSVAIVDGEEAPLQWETAKLDDPETWAGVEKELSDSLSVYEFGRVLTLVQEANALDEEKLEENAASFFQLRAECAQKSKSLNSGKKNTSDSKLANVGA